MLPLPPHITPDLFPSLSRWSFFNHSGVSPLPKPAVEAMQKYLTESTHDAYVTGGWYKQAEVVRKRAATLINSEVSEIAFTKNTSEGLAFVANGITWQPGDEILSVRGEYPANVYPWMAAQQRYGVKHVVINPRPDGRVLPEDIFAAVTPKTRLITLSHVEFGTGFRIDITAIGDYCRTHKNARGEKLLFCVDAIQSIGSMPFDVKAAHIDYLSAGGHKWMLGPEGAGIFFCRKELLDSLYPEVGSMNVINATDFSTINFTLKPDARRFECGGYNIPGILALGASLELLLSVGIDTIWSRIHALTNLLADGVSAKGYNVFSPRKTASECSGILSFSAPDPTHHAAIAKDLQDKKVIIVERENRLRAAPHFYQGETQIQTLLDALPQFAT